MPDPIDRPEEATLDLQGKPIESRLPYGLVGDGTLAPTDLALTFGGEMTYMADAARLTECLTGRSYPIAMEGEYVKLERAYREAVAQPGAPLCVTFEGALTDRPRMEGEGVERTLVVRRFIGVWPEERCERARADAALTNTYWRIVRLGGAPVEPAEGRREPHLLLRADGERPGYSATVGCNQMAGSYSVAGDTLAFRPGATTLMACPPPLDALERSLGEALSRTVRWRIKGNTLELTDADGAVTARFEAVYF